MGAGDDGAPRGAREQDAPRERRRGRHDRDTDRRGRSTAWSWVRETAIILVSALVLSLVVKTFLVQAFFIPSQSMHETLVENDRILVSKLTPGPRDLQRGDIVVFKDPGGWLQPVVQPERGPVGEALNDGLTWIGLLPQDAGEHLVKRVIGLPGDRVACTGPGEPVTVNGVPIDEPYLAAGSQPSEKAFDVVVPEGSVWVMGDNRQHSADSRYNQGRPGGGSVPVDNIVGVAFVTVWPVDRVTVLRNPSDTFAGVPDPS
ncbi:signal peptidase I [Cellulomonas shaoxiangyii]|uniref:Signal peptidase I n=2 Tax=Cellulomonas shaoxiangyii TaxID=2566013 RepID=A0A4P7SRG9_9CELL|nr:signal peptidase I [Cellulomonas shaoxiangyii]TGY81777.1 signal peptidase I [Cellulomonas shaoxiangyii]